MFGAAPPCRYAYDAELGYAALTSGAYPNGAAIGTELFNRHAPNFFNLSKMVVLDSAKMVAIVTRMIYVIGRPDGPPDPKTQLKGA